MNQPLILIEESIDAQITRVLDTQVFKEEASYIQKTCELSGLKRVTDLGSWAGVLAKEVFDTGIALDNYHLVDGVGMYMDRALTLLENQPITHELVTLIPQGHEGPEPQTMLVNPYDTLNTSSIYSEHFVSAQVKQGNCRVELAQTESVPDYIARNLDKFGKDTYVKIDLDGVDINMVDELLAQGLEPGALQFEVWSIFRNGYARVAKLLKEKGYRIPPMDLDLHKNYSVGISKDYYWAVGYDIVGNKYVHTYYDLEHGDFPVPQI